MSAVTVSRLPSDRELPYALKGERVTFGFSQEHDRVVIFIENANKIVSWVPVEPSWFLDMVKPILLEISKVRSESEP